MDLTQMRLTFPGLLAEKPPSGAIRYRVRVEGNKARRIPLSVTPDHPQFMEVYRAARAGIRIEPEASAEERAIRAPLAGWLPNIWPRWSVRSRLAACHRSRSRSAAAS